jgi:hypothetical protein
VKPMSALHFLWEVGSIPQKMKMCASFFVELKPGLASLIAKNRPVLDSYSAKSPRHSLLHLVALWREV